MTKRKFNRMLKHMKTDPDKRNFSGLLIKLKGSGITHHVIFIEGSGHKASLFKNTLKMEVIHIMS